MHAYFNNNRVKHCTAFRLVKALLIPTVVLQSSTLTAHHTTIPLLNIPEAIVETQGHDDQDRPLCKLTSQSEHQHLVSCCTCSAGGDGSSRETATLQEAMRWRPVKARPIDDPPL